jgi:type IV secretory pathway VirB2 component (pilin)
MVYGNTAVVFMVLAVVAVGLAITFAGTYFLNKAVDQTPESGH